MRNFLASSVVSLIFALGLPACGGDGGGGSSSTGGGGGTSGSGGGGGSGGTSGTSGSGGSGGGVNPPPAECPAPKDPVDVSSPNAVVGDGSAASCTEAALDGALAKGGVITFSCGAAPVTITVSAQKEIKADTVLDGGGKVTLSGGGKTRILHVASAWDQVAPHLTVQNLALTGGFTSDLKNTKETTQGGAAIFREGGTLDVINCTFSNNTCATTGQDVSGGAITSQGVGETVIVGSAFSNNTGSNGGAVGNLGNGLTVVNSSFDGNHATGTDGNPGNGGNGGAIVFDGADTAMSICGSVFTNNTAGAQGGAIFRVSYTNEPTTIDRSTFEKNSADAAVGLAGALYLEHTVITMTATTISENSAHYGGGFWVGHAAVANLTNVTIANNIADQGGGLWFASEVSGKFLCTTIAGNELNPGGYANGIFTGGNAVSFVSSLIVDNGCKDVGVQSGGVNLEFNSTGKCVDGALGDDPALGPLQDNGGPTKTMAPAAGSPAIGKGTECPVTDQRGQPRKQPCTLGAVEAG